MNILKHMEAAFIATMALTISASYVIDTLPEAHAKPAVTATAAAAVPVITVSAKRMTADEKARSLRDEQKIGDAGAAPASRT